MEHSSDNFSMSADQDDALYSHRAEAGQPGSIHQTFKLQKNEARILLETMLAMPGYQEIAMAKLERDQIARPNHSI